MSKLTFKIPAIIFLAALVAGLGNAVSGIVLSTQAQHETAEERVDFVVKSRASALKTYLETIETDLTTLSTSPVAFEAISAFKDGWTELSAKEATQALQAAYITGNPNPTGKKEELDRADGPQSYHRAHGHFHPWYRAFLRAKGFYDIFLFDTGGNLVYTVFKELDYATNFDDGPYAGTGLGRAYRAAMAEPDKVYFDDFEGYAPSHGAPASFISTGVFDDTGKLVGVLAFQMPIDRLNAVMQDSSGLGEGGDTVIIGADKLRRSDSRFAADSRILAETIAWPGVDAVLGGASGGVIGEVDGEEVISAYKPVIFNGTTWGVLSILSTEEAFAASRQLVLVEILIGAGVLLVALLMGNLFSRTITRPLSRIVGVMAMVSGGDYAVDVPAKERRDEVGDIARALDVFRMHGKEAAELRAEQERLRERAEIDRVAALENMAKNVERESGIAVGQVSKETDAMTVQADGMASSAERVEQNSQAVAAAAQEALANAESVSAATEQLAASIEEISARVADGAVTAREAMQVGESSQATIQTLSDAAKQIGTVAVLIDDIAQQTGLLALNATIEAARAGDAGKGFAVVASEVKNLAAQTARATGEISGQIQEIQAITQRSVDAVRTMVERIRQVDDVSATVATAVEEQQAATQEIARNVSETAAAARDVAVNIELVSAEARSNRDSAAAVQTASEHVKAAIENLKQAVVRVVRTAAPEVERRRSRRTDVNEAGTLTVDGSSFPVTILNASEGGAGVELEEDHGAVPGHGHGEIAGSRFGRRAVRVASVSGRYVGLQYVSA